MKSRKPSGFKGNSEVIRVPIQDREIAKRHRAGEALWRSERPTGAKFCIGYWHDVGHAQIFENLGFFRHQSYLERFRSRLIGIHLHDCRVNHDHLAPGAGTVQFEMVSQYLISSSIKVLELDSRVSSEEIRQGLTFFEQRGIV